MITPIWIVCESTPRWAPALRQALARDQRYVDVNPRLVEVRRLEDAWARLAAQPGGLLWIESSTENLPAVLEGLPAVLERYPSARAMAMCDRLLENSGVDCQVEAALWEAGFVAWTTSPRRLEDVLQIARRHSVLVAQYQAARRRPQSPTDEVWASLPWQAEPAPLG